MAIALHSATGCIRCRMVRQLLKERGLTYQDYDALLEGKDAFRSFYQANRQRIYRGPDGVEFSFIVKQSGDPPEISYITPEKVAETAKHIKTATCANRQPYGLRLFDPKIAVEERLRRCKALTQNTPIKYRAQARKHQFKTEIFKCPG